MMGRRAGRPNRQMPDGRNISTRELRYDKACKACGNFGHSEETCSALAINICSKRYMDKKLVDDVKLVLDNWQERNKKWVGKGRTVSTILTEHMARTNMPMQQVEAEIDWNIINWYK